MRSTVDAFGEIINCHQLVLCAQFYRLNADQVDEMARLFYDFINNKFESCFVLDWHFNNKALNDLEQCLRQEKNSYRLYSIMMDGDYRSGSINNKTSLRKHGKRLQYDMVFNSGKVPPFCAVDYPDYKANNINPYRNSPELFKSAIIKLFLEDHPEILSQYHNHDMGGMFHVSCTEDEPESFFGSINIYMSVYCAEDELDSFADEFAGFARQCSKAFININASIALSASTMGKDYECYFYGYPNKDTIRRGSGLLLKAHYLYLNNVGWSNIISPATRVLDEGLLKTCNSNHPIYYLEELTGGGIVVQSNESITRTNLCDLLEIKKRIYGSLFPGRVKFGLDWNFRGNWENIPLLDEEITVSAIDVVISHCKDLNIDYVKEVMNIND